MNVKLEKDKRRICEGLSQSEVHSQILVEDELFTTLCNVLF